MDAPGADGADNMGDITENVRSNYDTTEYWCSMLCNMQILFCKVLQNGKGLEK